MAVVLAPDCEQWLKTRGEIDRAGETYRSSPTDSVSLRKVQCYRLFRLMCVPELMVRVSECLEGQPTVASARLKQLKTIVRKLDRFPEMRLSRMVDVVGARIICDSALHCKSLADTLVAALDGTRIKDYVTDPQESGYRAYHVFVRVKQLLPQSTAAVTLDVEIQVRSYLQHLWALASEQLGEQVKEGGGTETQRAYLRELSRSFAIWENNNWDAVQEDMPVYRGRLEACIVTHGGSGEPKLDPYFEDLGSAARQLMTLEDNLRAPGTASVLLFSLGNQEVLDLTHATLLGIVEVPLPDWAPRLAVDGANTESAA